MILISSCLCGAKCRYNGTAKPNEEAIRLMDEGKAIAACPEAMGGLKIPRPPAEICGGDGDDVLRGSAKVLDKDGKDVTSEFLNGAKKFAQYAQKIGANEVWLKAKSPSCGVNTIYDGTFSSKIIEGCGVACSILKKSGIIIKEIP